MDLVLSVLDELAALLELLFSIVAIIIETIIQSF